MTLPHNRNRLESQRTLRRTRRFQVESLEPRCLLAVTINEFPVPTADSAPGSITTGPDGNLWFTETSGNKIGQINPTTHAFAEFPVPTASSTPQGITTGPDGNLWFTETSGNKIGQINPTTHAFAEFPVPTASSGPLSITTGPDGNLWFTESFGNKIGQINPTTHAFAEFPVPTAGSVPVSITTGPDGNLWFTERNVNKIGQINPTTHAFAEFPVPTAGSAPQVITTGPDGNLWFTEALGNKIGQVVNSAPTTTTVVLSVPQTIQTFGQAIPITAQVDSNGQPASGATGTVTFSEGSTVLAVVAVTGGSATYAPTGLGTGAHVITATYSGDVDFKGSTSQTTQTVVAATTYTILTSSAQVAIFGQPITYSASSFSIAPGVGVPTGTIAFYDGSTLIGSSALVNGQASLVVTASDTGAVHDIHAVYTPDSANFLTHTTGDLHDSVIKSNSTILFYYQVSARGVGFPTTVIGTLPGAGLPTGSLTLFVNGRSVGSQQLVNGMGGIFVPRNIARGKTFSVAYSGDANFNPSVSKPVKITQAILNGGSSPIQVFRAKAARAIRGHIG
jgi:streptogramin lyase